MIPRKLPCLGDDPDYSRAFYADPSSHDFCVWLIMAELNRRLFTPDKPLTITLGLHDGMLGKVEYGNTGIACDSPSFPNRCDLPREYYDQMLAGIMRPAMAMIGVRRVEFVEAPFDREALKNHVEYDYHLSGLVDAARVGAKIPKWTSPQWARNEVERVLMGRKPIVITLREVENQPERNSNLAAWRDFCGWAMWEGHDVLVVRDAAKADVPFENVPTYPVASQSAYIRMALYERALVNMMVCNGPTVWAMFSDVPWLMFKQLIPALPNWDHGQAKGWLEQDHITVGEQLPWSAPNQRMTWSDDTFENIVAAFEAFPKAA